MTYKIGTRVKVVWAKDTSLVGLEGVITQILGPWPCRDSGDVRLGYGLSTSPIRWNGECWLGFAEDQLTPIVDSHEPAEKDFVESLDHLLSRLKGVEA